MTEVPDAPARPKYKAPFTKFPTLWKEVLAKAQASGSTYAIALELLDQGRKRTSLGYAPAFNFTSEMARRAGVGKDQKGVAVDNLEELKLISVDRRDGKNPIITLCFIA